MNTLATTIEQSKRLLELGLDPDSADMWWSNRFVYWQPTPMIGISAEQHQLYAFKWCDEDVPAWSLSALLEVMPKENEPDLQKSPATGQYFMYGFFDLEIPTYMTKDYDSPIDAAYEMVCWLLEQGLIKKGDNDE